MSLLSTAKHLNLKSTPIVVWKFSVKLSSANLSNTDDLPTPVSPIRTILSK